MSAAHVITVAK